MLGDQRLPPDRAFFFFPAFSTRTPLNLLAALLKRVSTEMALHVLAYNLTRVMNIMGSGPLIAAIRS
jgi:hypothetical protein